MTTAEADYGKAKTSVWWDIENCEVPRSQDANTIVQNVISALLKMNYGGPVSIFAYGDTNLIPLPTLQALSSTGVRLNHVPAGVKDASDKKILVDMLIWAIDNPAPANIMLISGDRDFSYALHQLRMKQYNILLAQPPHASAPLVVAAKNVWLWTSLAAGGPPLTSGESSLLVNNVRCHVSNNEVSKHTVSEQVQSSKPTDSTSDSGGSPQDKRRNISQNGETVTASRICSVVSDGSVNFTKHLANKRNISQAAFVDSCRAHASVSAKPVQEAVVGEPVLCKVCQISCANTDAYKSHTYGKKHRNNLELQSGKYQNNSVGPVEPSKEVLDKHKKNKKAIEIKAKANSDFACRMCNVVCHSQTVFDSHLRGKKHAEMLTQSEALIDSKKFQEKGVGEKDQPRETIAEPQLQSQKAQENTKFLEEHVSMASKPEVLVDSKKHQVKCVEDQPREITVQRNGNHVCRLCNVVCQSQIVFDSHLKGKKHAEKLNQSKALTDSKKLQEEGVREKGQPRETNAEPPNALENSKCSKKHVVMVNESEELINAKKLVEKDVQDKAQSVETIAKSQSQSQNTLEHTEDLRKICGASESLVKEPFPSTKDKQIPNGGSFSDFELDREAGECPDGIVKPINLSKGATEHSREVKMRKEMMVRQAVRAVHKLCPRCVVICDSQGLSTVVCDFKALWQRNAKNTDLHLKSQNHSAMSTEQTEVALVVDSKIRGRTDKEQEITDELKERHIISENLLHCVFTEQNRESGIPNELRGCLDVIPERVKQPPNVSMAKKLEEESQHPGEASKKEEIKDQTVDNFWTRLWGKKG